MKQCFWKLNTLTFQQGEIFFFLLAWFQHTFLQLLYCDKQAGVSVHATGWQAFLGSLQISQLHILYYEKDAVKTYQLLQLHLFICSFVTSFTGQLRATLDVISCYVHSFSCWNIKRTDVLHPLLQILTAPLQYRGIWMDVEVASFPKTEWKSDMPLN